MVVLLSGMQSLESKWMPSEKSRILRVVRRPPRTWALRAPKVFQEISDVDEQRVLSAEQLYVVLAWSYAGYFWVHLLCAVGRSLKCYKRRRENPINFRALTLQCLRFCKIVVTYGNVRRLYHQLVERFAGCIHAAWKTSFISLALLKMTRAKRTAAPPILPSTFLLQRHS